MKSEFIITNKKHNDINKIFAILLISLCFLFVRSECAEYDDEWRVTNMIDDDFIPKILPAVNSDTKTSEIKEISRLDILDEMPGDYFLLYYETDFDTVEISLHKPKGKMEKYLEPDLRPDQIYTITKCFEVKFNNRIKDGCVTMSLSDLRLIMNKLQPKKMVHASCGSGGFEFCE